jgi:undecaprenyl-diphosphatase
VTNSRPAILSLSLPMDFLIELDQKLFLELNGLHTPWLDPVMFFLTRTTPWLPLYAFLLYLIIRAYGKEAWAPVVAIALTILFADQFTSSFMKPFFERFRPSHEPALEGLVHIVNNYRGGRFGFASSHAANTFGVATLMWKVLTPYRPWIGLLFPWALLVSYTRIYLGVHYPGDILVGGLVGFLSALLAWFIARYANDFFTRQRPAR